MTQTNISITVLIFFFFSSFFWENSCLSMFYKNMLKNPILIRWNKLKFFVEKVLVTTCCFSGFFFFFFFFFGVLLTMQSIVTLCLFSKKSPLYNLRIIFWSSCRLKTFFHFKDRIAKYLRSGLVYKFKCAGCPIMVKPNAILKYEPVNTWEYPLWLEKELHLYSNRLPFLKAYNHLF